MRRKFAYMYTHKLAQLHTVNLINVTTFIHTAVAAGIVRIS